jgi:hypothetical protein
MIAGIPQTAVVGEGEKIEIWMPESPSGARVEVIVLVEAEGRGTAVFWFSTAANRDRWLQALWKIDDPTGYVCWIVSDGY